jgi:hypothetical protein
MAVDNNISDDEWIPAPHAGLPAAYGAVVTVIESSEDELTLDAVVTKLLNTEARVAIEEQADAHMVTPPSMQPQQETQTCYHCGKQGHLHHKCHARNSAERPGSQAKALMAGQGVPSPSSSSVWLVDSGASHHLCADRLMMCDFRESHVTLVTTANYGAGPMKGLGGVQLTVHGTIGRLRDVLYVLDLVTNLLSLSKLVDQGMPVEFARDSCDIGPRDIGPREAPIAVAVRQAVLFCLHCKSACGVRDANVGRGVALLAAAAIPD